MTGMKSDDFIAKRLAAVCARPSGTLAAEKNFSDVHAAGKMIKMIRRLRAANSARLLNAAKFNLCSSNFPQR